MIMVSSRISQLIPVMPVAQTHRYPSPPFTTWHVPLFWQGLLIQALSVRKAKRNKALHRHMSHQSLRHTCFTIDANIGWWTITNISACTDTSSTTTTIQTRLWNTWISFTMKMKFNRWIHPYETWLTAFTIATRISERTVARICIQSIGIACTSIQTWIGFTNFT